MKVIELVVGQVFGLHKVAGSWWPLPYIGKDGGRDIGKDSGRDIDKEQRNVNNMNNSFLIWRCHHQDKRAQIMYARDKYTVQNFCPKKLT